MSNSSSTLKTPAAGKPTFYTGKVVWITGASSGIGEALAYDLSRKGASLILSARRVDRLEKVKQNCDPRAEIMILPLDLAQPESMPSKVSEALERFGKIDFLINNAGIGQSSLIQDTYLDIYRRVWEVNFLGAVALTQAVLPIFTQQGYGHLTFVSSVLGKMSIAERSGYSASKAAANAFFDTLRLEYRDKNVKVLCIYSGGVKTEIDLNALNGSGEKIDQIPEGYEEALAPQEVARRIVRAIQKGKATLTVGVLIEKIAFVFSRFLPNLFYRILPVDTKAIVKTEVGDPAGQKGPRQQVSPALTSSSLSSPEMHSAAG